MPQIYGTNTGATTLTLSSPPGVAGTVGKKVIVIDGIVGHIFTNAAAAGTVYSLVVADANGTVFHARFSPSANTTVATPVNISFPDNIGPRCYASGATPVTVATAAVVGTAISRCDIFCTYHYE